MPDRADSSGHRRRNEGRVIVDGKDTKHYEVYQMAQSSDWFFRTRKISSVHWTLRAKFHLARKTGFAESRDRRHVKAALNAVNLDDLRRKYTFNLLGGEKHKTVIASEAFDVAENLGVG